MKLMNSAPEIPEDPIPFSSSSVAVESHKSILALLNPAALPLPSTAIFTGHLEPTFITAHAFDSLSKSFTSKPFYESKKRSQNFHSHASSPLIPPDFHSRKRVAKGDSSDVVGYLGPWAGYEGELKGSTALNPSQEELEEAGLGADVKDSKSRNRFKKDEVPMETEKSTFHGKSLRDYQGRTYMFPPTDVPVNLSGEPGAQECFVPKRLVHTWSGHTGGVTKIRFFPKTAHLLLSCGNDGKIKLWDVYHERKCLRTFSGHSAGVRDICFNRDGSQFLSVSFDKWIKLWDTESGKCLKRYTTGKAPICVAIHPDSDKQHLFLVGCSDNKIHQYDMNTDEVVQEYDQHLGAINTITFIDEARRFVTTSDDKTLRVWEFGIPVVIKYIADPAMHSMPAITLHPNGKWLAATSLDNQIVIFSAGDKVRQHRKKVFKGHLIAGYATQPGFSPDGRFVMSGDSEGKIWFWDWKTSRIYGKFKAHDKVTIGCLWNPHESSKVVTCSWDGSIKYWD